MIKNNVGELIGNTPLVRLNKLVKNSKAEVIAKLEYYNPASSIKDRIAWAMIEDAESKGIINSNTTIIEPSSGNTGVGLALVCAIKGYRLIVVMPESMSVERRKIMAGMGAEIVLTESALGMTGAVNKSQSLLKEIFNSHMLMQFDNKANPEIHMKTTAEEIWRDTDGKIDIVIAGVGTGGTISGVGRILKKYNPSIKMIAVEPDKSPVISGGKASAHKIQGIGAGFIPNNYDKEIVDEVFTVSNEDAIRTAQDLMRYEGILAGISSGANAWAALEISKRFENEGKMILFFACDTSERYLSTELFDF